MGGGTLPDARLAGGMVPPKFEAVDPQNDAMADLLAIRSGTKTLAEAIAQQGRNPDAALAEIARIEGILLCPEGAATYAALRKALEDGRVGPTETAVLFNCATGLKYPMPAAGRPIDLNEPRDFTALASE